MAKRQTRRSVSLNRGSYYELQAACAARGVSMSSVVESLAKAWVQSGAAVDVIRATPAPRALPMPQVELQTAKAAIAVRIAAREAMARAAITQREIAAAVQRRREREAFRNTNPCRQERCSIVGLHAAHEDRP